MSLPVAPRDATTLLRGPMALADSLDRVGGLGRFQSILFPGELLTSHHLVENVLAPAPVIGTGFPSLTVLPCQWVWLA